MRPILYFVLAIILIALGYAFYQTEKAPPVPDVPFDEPAITKVLANNVPYYGDGETVGYLTRPEGSGKYHGLILLHDWWGLNDTSREQAEDFAAQGYVVLVADLYNGQVATSSEQAAELAEAVEANIAEAALNLRAARDYLASLDYVTAASLSDPAVFNFPETAALVWQQTLDFLAKELK